VRGLGADRRRHQAVLPGVRRVVGGVAAAGVAGDVHGDRQYAFTAAHVVAPAVVALSAVSSWLPWAVPVAATCAAVGVQRALGAMLPAELDRVG
jgi:hypothetical protein